jgi:hypothetical protein
VSITLSLLLFFALVTRVFLSAAALIMKLVEAVTKADGGDA